jgi:transposase
VTAGIDWATADHVACVVDSAGQVRGRFSAAHDRAGIRKLTGGLRAEGAAEVAIERGEGILVDALLAAGLTVVVITSRQVKNLRSRYGSAGARRRLDGPGRHRYPRPTSGDRLTRIMRTGRLGHTERA